MDLREFRESLELAQDVAAKKAKLSAPAFCSAELGNRWPSPETVLKIMRWSIDPKTGEARVTADDLLRTWCKKNGEKYPGAAKIA